MSQQVQSGFKSGMVLFIVSEVMFFFAFFLAFFHSALAPAPEIGSMWPPMGRENAIKSLVITIMLGFINI